MSTEKRDYKSTVLTPKTDYPMKANLPEREPLRAKRWEEMGLYQKMQENRAGRPTYIFHDGPPYANGDIHLGHTLNKVLKDVVVRYKTLKGFRAPFVPGWDCHGLPIEQQVQKNLGGKLNQMKPAEVRKLCQEYANKFVGIQRNGFKRLGISADWEKPYLTMDPSYEAGILSALRDLVAKGFVRKGLKPVHWDPVFRTALAEAEIEYEKHESPSIYVKFPLREPEKIAALGGLLNISVVIWTTTPWTLPANLAVCLHPDFTYVILKSGGEHHIVARELAESFVKECGIEGAETAGELRGRELEGALCDHPIFPGKTSLVILGDHVTLEAGTGCVHTAPGHGMDDYLVGKKYGLPVVVPVDDAGKFTDEYPEMKGTFVFDANPKIVEFLKEKGILLGYKPIVHDYPHSWRSHKPIIFRATEQWFMELAEGGARARALKAIDDEVRWIPTWGRERIVGMVSQRPDWCLSRQRSWGVPIPAIRSKKTGKSLLDARLLDSFIKVVEQKGTDAWYTDDLATFWPKGFSHEDGSSPEDFEKEWDILDVWFDSGASHIAVLERDERLSSPADLYLEGSDQHRGWFQSSLLISIGTRDRAPFRGVLTHGFLLDGAGKAMSKSLGNVISPLDEIKKRGADVLRLWVCMEDYRSDVRVSENILTQVSEAYRRIRNTMRFLLGNLHDFDLAMHAVPYASLEETDRWCLSQLAKLIEECDRAYEEFEFHKVYQQVYGFCNVQLSSIYLDVLKDRLYCSAPEDATRRAGQTVLHHLLDAIARIIAPILVFTADETWEYWKGASESVHLADFPSVNADWKDPQLEAKWERILKIKDEAAIKLEEARRAKVIGHSLDACVEIAPADPAESEFLTESLALLKNVFIVSAVQRGIEGSPERISVRHADDPKCDRCWMWLPSVGKDADHPGLCERCSDVVRRLPAS